MMTEIAARSKAWANLGDENSAARALEATQVRDQGDSSPGTIACGL